MIPVRYTTVSLFALLGLSVMTNIWLGQAYLSQRDAAKMATERHQQALNDAAACSAGVTKLRRLISEQAEAHAEELKRARRAAQSAAKRAAAERYRPQAVPGDACASAEVETREWLERRRTEQ